MPEIQPASNRLDTNPIDGHTFIFIGGLHRSGTSLFFRMLREHPAISGFRNTGVPEDEGQHLQTVYPPAAQYGGPGRFGFDPEARLTETSLLVTSSQRATLFRDWSRHWDLTKRFLLEKSPPNLIRTRFLQKMFPSSFFLILLRHPIAVSLATQRWCQSDLGQLLQHWVFCHQLFDVDRPHLRRVKVVYYEDLIADSDRVLAEVFSFIGLPALRCTAEVKQNANQKYLVRWQEISGSDCGSIHKEELIARYEPDILPFGYSLRCPERRVAAEEISQT
jgi:hypothetical protein